MAASNHDIRIPMGALALTPWLLWIAGIIAWIMKWPNGYGFTTFVVCSLLGGIIVKKMIGWLYVLAKGFLPPGYVARPAENFLFFELEDVATVHRLKLFGDDMGCIFPEQGRLRIRTSRRDITLSPDQLKMEPYRPKGKIVGVLMSWPEQNGGPVYSAVATFKYAGNDLEIAGDQERRAKWALDIIKGWSLSPTHRVPSV